MRESTWSCGVVSAVVSLIVDSMYDVWTSRSLNCPSNLSMTMDICVSASSLYSLTRSRFMLSIALSIPRTTLAMLPVTVRIVTAVSTRLATASIREARRRRLRPSVFFRIAFCA